MEPRLPSYDGSGLVNLVAHLERQLTGSAPSPGLTPGLAEAVRPAAGYVLVIFDGLGDHQLTHPLARSLGESRRASLTTGFPTTTTVNLATVATGLTPAGHGIVGHLMHLPGVAEVVNVLKWLTPSGRPVAHPYHQVLPTTLWERLGAAGLEPITVQPGDFLGSPLTAMLYRGCRFEAVHTLEEMAAATIDLAGPGRLVVTYLPNIDVAAHVHGQDSEAYRQAITAATRLWDAIAARLAPDVGLVGTADHGHIDYRPVGKRLVRDRRFDVLSIYGDPRAVLVRGDADLAADLATVTGSRLVDLAAARPWWGPGPAHPELAGRLPDWVLLAEEGEVALPRGFDRRLVGYHGGLDPREVDIPLLVGR